MTILDIYTYPEKVLREKAKPIETVDRSLWAFAEKMLETMYQAPGVGLAANQVGFLKRLFVLDIDYEMKPQEEDLNAMASSSSSPSACSPVVLRKNPIVMINPEILIFEGSQIFEEGCLSVPGVHAKVERYDKIQLQYQDLDGKKQKLLAEGFLAVVIQHELDHLNGKLFIDYLSARKKTFLKKKLKAEKKKAQKQKTKDPK